jgi:hypothetical protein
MVYNTQNYWVSGLCPEWIMDRVQTPSNSDSLCLFTTIKTMSIYLLLQIRRHADSAHTEKISEYVLPLFCWKQIHLNNFSKFDT